jgi:hypothetical protein
MKVILGFAHARLQWRVGQGGMTVLSGLAHGAWGARGGLSAWQQ